MMRRRLVRRLRVAEFHFRAYTGPEMVSSTAERLYAMAPPGFKVTTVGTQHVHFAVPSLTPYGAELATRSWWLSAGLRLKPSDLEPLGEHGIQVQSEAVVS